MIKISEMPSVGPNEDNEFGHIVQGGTNKQAVILFKDDGGVPNVNASEIPFDDSDATVSATNIKDALDGLVEEAPMDGNLYARQMGVWVIIP